MIQLIRADARRIPLADESVQCVVSSPPYWGLRKYAGEQELIWGGAEGCKHEWEETLIKGQSGGRNQGSKQDDPGGCTYRPSEDALVGSCATCGAWRGAFGLEPTIEMYVGHSVLILREIGRVLRRDGVLFWNIGDCYATGAGKVGQCPGGGARGETWKNGPKRYRDDTKGRGTPSRADGRGGHVYYGPMTQPNRMPQDGLKPKDLVLMPARIALAAQADGWWVRSDIIWAKPNPMPESVKDRPTDAYEHILMLTKSQKYFWDPGAVREKASDPGRPNWKKHNRRLNELDAARPPDSAPHTLAREDWRGRGRNLRNFWRFSTQPYKGAHFATFPEELPRRCIKAASRPGDLILDPFAGSGTVGRVALELQRRAVLLDLAYHAGGYKELAEQRTCNVQVVQNW